VEEELNLITAKVGQLFQWQNFIISNKELSRQGITAKFLFPVIVPDEFNGHRKKQSVMFTEKWMSIIQLWNICENRSS